MSRIYAGVGDKTKKPKKLYAGVNGSAKLSYAEDGGAGSILYAGVNNQADLIYGSGDPDNPYQPDTDAAKIVMRFFCDLYSYRYYCQMLYHKWDSTAKWSNDWFVTPAVSSGNGYTIGVNIPLNNVFNSSDQSGWSPTAITHITAGYWDEYAVVPPVLQFTGGDGLKYFISRNGVHTKNIMAGNVAYGETDPAEVTAVYNNLNSSTAGNFFDVRLTDGDNYVWYSIAREE
jgi:hypothetical protein